MKKSFLKHLPFKTEAFIGLLLFFQCTNVIKRTFPDSHSSEKTLDWNGTYKTTQPNATYSGTLTEIILDTARTYIIKKTYLDKGVQPEKGTEERGTFSWNRMGNIITLLGIKNQPNQFFVGENRLWELDKKGHKITTNDSAKYVLNKVMTAPTTDAPMPKTPQLTGSWELDYIAGSPTEFQELYARKRPTIIFDTLNNLVSGSTSCNNYVGKLSVNGLKIDFLGPLAITKMACLDSKGNGENLFLETLKRVNNYSLNPDSTLNFIMGDIATMRFSKK
jgi:heat shock protein HslJ